MECHNFTIRMGTTWGVEKKHIRPAAEIIDRWIKDLSRTYGGFHKYLHSLQAYNPVLPCYNTLVLCQSNFVRVNRPGDSMPLSCQNAKNSEKLESLQHLNDGYEAILCNDWERKHGLKILLFPCENRKCTNSQFIVIRCLHQVRVFLSSCSPPEE